MLKEIIKVPIFVLCIPYFLLQLLAYKILGFKNNIYKYKYNKLKQNLSFYFYILLFIVETFVLELGIFFIFTINL